MFDLSLYFVTSMRSVRNNIFFIDIILLSFIAFLLQVLILFNLLSWVVHWEYAFICSCTLNLFLSSYYTINACILFNIAVILYHSVAPTPRYSQDVNTFNINRIEKDVCHRLELNATWDKSTAQSNIESYILKLTSEDQQCFLSQGSLCVTYCWEK